MREKKESENSYVLPAGKLRRMRFPLLFVLAVLVILFHASVEAALDSSQSRDVSPARHAAGYEPVTEYRIPSMSPGMTRENIDASLLAKAPVGTPRAFLRREYKGNLTL